MSRRTEVESERDRIAGIARTLCMNAVNERRELTPHEDAEVNDCLAVLELMQMELQTLPEDVVPLVRLDSRLTQDRTTPLSPKVCAENIAALETELAGCFDANRRAGIEIELQTWKREREFAHARMEQILNTSKYRRFATV